MLNINRLSPEQEDALLIKYFNEEPDIRNMAVISEDVINTALKHNCIPSAFVTRDAEEYAACLEAWNKLYPSVPIIEIDRNKLSECLCVASSHGIFAIMDIGACDDPSDILKSKSNILIIDLDEDTIEGRLSRSSVPFCSRNTLFDATGTSIRTAVALGIDAVLFTESSARYLDHRLIRQSMGTILRLPIAFIPDLNAGGIELLKENGFTTFSLETDLNGRAHSKSIRSPGLFSMTKKAFVIQDRLPASRVDYNVFPDFCEPLGNVDIVASITVILWELLK